MTPDGPGVVKFFFAAGGSLKRPASYTVTLPHRRPGVVFLEPELQQLTVYLSSNVEKRGAVGRTQVSLLSGNRVSTRRTGEKPDGLC